MLKNDHNSKKYVSEKSEIWFFLSIQPIPHLSYKFDLFWKKNWFDACNPCMQNIEETIAKYAVDSNLLPLGWTNPKKKSLVLDDIW